MEVGAVHPPSQRYGVAGLLNRLGDWGQSPLPFDATQ
jgi:hypothetical protein